MGRRAGQERCGMRWYSIWLSGHFYITILQGDSGWVDIDLGISPGWWAATVATAQAGWWNIPNLSQPNQGIPLKCVSKILGQLSDSRTSYIASVTIVQRSG